MRIKRNAFVVLSQTGTMGASREGYSSLCYDELTFLRINKLEDPLRLVKENSARASFVTFRLGRVQRRSG